MRRNFVKSFLRLLPVILLCQMCLRAPSLAAQDWVHTGTNLGNQTIRLAAADFKPVGSDPQTTALKAVFDHLFDDARADDVTVDVHGLRFADRAAAGILVGAGRGLRRLRLVGCSPALVQLLEYCGAATAPGLIVEPA